MPEFRDNRIKTCVIGATGLVGQAFILMLCQHPYFDLTCLVASPGKRGLPYKDAVKWCLPRSIPPSIKNKRIESLDPQRLKKQGIRIIFSALPADTASEIESELRTKGFYIFSNASAFRMAPDVPILIPEVNQGALKKIEEQGYPDKGFIVTNANCTTTGLAVALAPLRRFGILEVVVSTYQSVSGAGYPGISHIDITDNAIPYIHREEEKMATELNKILEVRLDLFPTCVRVPALWGHLVSTWVTFESDVTEPLIQEAWGRFRPPNINLPSMPRRPVIYDPEVTRPQPKCCFRGHPPGMSVFTGRLRQKSGKTGFILVVNNLIKGAAGGSVANAEAFIELCGGEP